MEITSHQSIAIHCASTTGLWSWLSGKESACWYKRLWRGRFNPWVRNIPCRRAGQPTPVFLPGESHEILAWECHRGAWWSRVHMVAKSQTWLNRLNTHECVDQPNGQQRSLCFWKLGNWNCNLIINQGSKRKETSHSNRAVEEDHKRDYP